MSQSDAKPSQPSQHAALQGPREDVLRALQYTPPQVVNIPPRKGTYYLTELDTRVLDALVARLHPFTAHRTKSAVVGEALRAYYQLVFGTAAFDTLVRQLIAEMPPSEG